MRGIILAGGTGSRLWPVTSAVSKQLLPVYDKPLIYYPLTTLMSAGIREILVISTPDDRESFTRLLGTGKQLGIQLEYQIQQNPEGLAQAFIIGADFIGREDCALILGDNLFYGESFSRQIDKITPDNGAVIFGYKVADPSAYGVVTINSDGEPISIVEKPTGITSSLAVPGLYFYDNDIVEVARSIKPSSRGELEISDVNSWYLSKGRLSVRQVPEGTAWLDTGTFSSLNDATQFVRVIQERQGLLVGCPEEVAWRRGWIDDDELIRQANRYEKSGYGQYLRTLIQPN